MPLGNRLKMSNVEAENKRSVSVRMSIASRHVTRLAGMDGIRLESLMLKSVLTRQVQSNYGQWSLQLEGQEVEFVLTALHHFLL